MGQDGPSMKEYAVLLGKDRSLVGILTENGDTDISEQKDLTGVLLLNAGLIHHIGPNRIYVKMARMLASMGFVVCVLIFPESVTVVRERQSSCNRKYE